MATGTGGVIRGNRNAKIVEYGFFAQRLACGGIQILPFPVLGAMNQRPVNYDTFIGGVTENLKNLLRRNADNYSTKSPSSNYTGFSGTGETY